MKLPPRVHAVALLLASLLVLNPLQAEEARLSAVPDPYAHVEVPPCKASIYIGIVTMTMGRFDRQGDSYVAPYQVKVMPFFFYSEHGTIRIQMDQDRIARVARGEKVSFTGLAVSSSGEKRQIEGLAEAASPLAGSLKIKVSATRSIRLNFPTSYRFVAGSVQGAK